MSLELFHPGLRGVVAGETEVSRLDGGLQYRGYCIHDLVEQSSFVEVAYLLIHEELPTHELLADFRSILVEEARLPPQIGWLFEQVPLHTSPIDGLRTAVSLLAHFDPQPDDDPVESAAAKATRLLSRIPMLLSLWHRQRSGLPLLEMDDALGHAANLLYLLTGQSPSVLHEHALEAALIVAAEQEFNPSTYACGRSRRTARSRVSVIRSTATAIPAQRSSSRSARNSRKPRARPGWKPWPTPSNMPCGTSGGSRRTSTGRSSDYCIIWGYHPNCTYRFLSARGLLAGAHTRSNRRATAA
jgi:citrate synthase